ncbi:MAG: FtsQ-type POTRA domain-containing protein, partial [Actinobacteria bacterium]|nr:FtsQ-type POTRA domain-containing protein [Actinomycetota bacterium]
MIKRHIRRRIIFTIILLSAITSTLLYIGWYSNLLIVKNIEVRGTQEIPVELVTETSQVSLNTQLLRVPTVSVVERLKTIPQVGNVEVRRGWPYTVVIDITERIPVALTDLAEGRFLVDQSGFPYLPAPSGANFPLISGPDDLSRNSSILVWQSFPDWLKPEIASTNADNPNSVWLAMTNG